MCQLVSNAPRVLVRDGVVAARHGERPLDGCLLLTAHPIAFVPGRRRRGAHGSPSPTAAPVLVPRTLADGPVP